MRPRVGRADGRAARHATRSTEKGRWSGIGSRFDTVKKSLKSIVGRIERRKRGTSARAKTPAAPKATKAPPTTGLGVPTAPGTDVTGQTIFDDRPLRFKSLTTAEANLVALEHPASIDGAFKIRLAQYAGGRREAGVLVDRRYTGRGYQTPAPVRDPSLMTFLAFDEGQIVGTVGVRLDSDQGLSADALYGVELDERREAGERLCEFTRLAVDTSSASKPVLAGLFHTAYLYAAVVCGFTHAVIEVNPRHVAYYRRALRFEPIGPERINARVMAPAVLLCVPFATIADGVARFAGKPELPGARSSLFVYGFPPADEAGVLQRLRGLVEEAEDAG